MDVAISVPIYIESRYKVDRKKIKARVEKVLREHSVLTPTEVSVAIVGDRKMKELNKKYRNLDKTSNVLSFAQTEGDVKGLPREFLLLGDVVISYPEVIREAATYHMLVDERVCELVEHGVRHLLGEHHE